MTPRVHRHFISTARRVSPSLHAAIVQIGRLEMPDRRGRGFAWFLARVIVGQQLSTSAARSIWARVEIAVKANGGSVPECFTGKNARVLRACGLSQNKVKALIAIREAHAAGLLSVQRLRRMTHAERSVHLTAIWGVGQWTADMASIFYFRDVDVWPQGDLGVYRGLERVTGKRSRRTLLKIANAFAPYRSFLALYMWRVLDGTVEGTPNATSGSKQPV
ncbi:MAG: DNA-3-methyladenine glycosylase family protein [Sulfurifustis sp.]